MAKRRKRPTQWVGLLKYGINNIKQLFESDLRVLSQINDH